MAKSVWLFVLLWPLLVVPTAVGQQVDTDGDGLIDDVETNTGVFVSPADTGTSPFRADNPLANRQNAESRSP